MFNKLYQRLLVFASLAQIFRQLVAKISFFPPRRRNDVQIPLDLIARETTQLFLIISIWWQAGILANMQVQALNGLYLIQSVENLLELDVVLKLNCLAIGKNL